MENDKQNYNKKHIFTIEDSLTGKRFTSQGKIVGWGGCTNYVFKTANNEASVKRIDLEDGKYTIVSMMRNRPVPTTYRVIDHRTENLYTEEEELKRQKMSKIHEYLSYRCGSLEYLFYKNPIRLELPSIGKTIDVSYFTKDWFGINDIINYKSDHVRMNDLSVDDLDVVFSKLF